MFKNLHNAIAHGQLIIAMTFEVRGCGVDTAPLDLATGPGTRKSGSGRIRTSKTDIQFKWSPSMPFSRLDALQGSLARVDVRLDVSCRGQDQRLRRRTAGERRLKSAQKCHVSEGPVKGLTKEKVSRYF